MTPENRIAKPTTAMPATASHGVSEPAVPRVIRTTPAAVRLTYAASRLRDGPSKRASTRMANDPNAANRVVSGSWMTPSAKANTAGITIAARAALFSAGRSMYRWRGIAGIDLLRNGAGSDEPVSPSATRRDDHDHGHRNPDEEHRRQGARDSGSQRITGSADADRPGDAAGGVPRCERGPRHATRAGQPGRGDAHHGDPAPEEHCLRAVAFEEPLAARQQTGALRCKGSAQVQEAAGAGTAEHVADVVAHDRRDRGHRDDDGQLEAAAVRQGCRGDQGGLAGQQKAHRLAADEQRQRRVAEVLGGDAEGRDDHARAAGSLGRQPAAVLRRRQKPYTPGRTGSHVEIAV